MKLQKTKIALGVATATLASVAIAPQAMAGSKTQHHAEVDRLERQVNEMADMMRSMQAELARVKGQVGNANVHADKVQELDQWMATVKATPAKLDVKEHQFSVRGGYMGMTQTRGASGVTNALGGIGDDILTSKTGEDAFYYGGAIDFNMNNDLFGFMDKTSFGIEFGIEYSELGDRKDSGLDNAVAFAAGAPATNNTQLQQTVTVNMLRINASPKIKFMHGSKLRPWVIPVGLDINIISPPSDAVTVLNTGMQFGAGLDYEILPGIVAGFDGRYHWTPDDVDGVDTDGFTVGGSVGFKF